MNNGVRFLGMLGTFSALDLFNETIENSEMLEVDEKLTFLDHQLLMFFGIRNIFVWDISSFNFY